MKKYNVVLMRGLIGNVYSRGMDALGAKLAKLPHVDYVTVEDYGSWRSIRDRIAKWRDQTIIGGHSFGSNAATVIPNHLPNVGFPLLLSFDPSQHWSWYLFRFGPAYIGPNVGRVVNFYQNGFPIGGQTLSTGDEDIANERVNSSHTEIDDLPLLHERAIAEVQKLAA